MLIANGVGKYLSRKKKLQTPSGAPLHRERLHGKHGVRPHTQVNLTKCRNSSTARHIKNAHPSAKAAFLDGIQRRRPLRRVCRRDAEEHHELQWIAGAPAHGCRVKDVRESASGSAQHAPCHLVTDSSSCQTTPAIRMREAGTAPHVAVVKCSTFSTRKY